MVDEIIFMIDKADLVQRLCLGLDVFTKLNVSYGLVSYADTV